MRLAVLTAITVLSGCASDRLSLLPPRGVDFSGHWKLNDADSDDPMHLLQTANQSAAGAGSEPDSGGGGGRGGRGGGRRGGGGAGIPGMRAPPTPSMSALSEAVRFPGKQIEVKQVGGIVAFTSGGKNRVCQPEEGREIKRTPHHRDSDRDAPLPAGRDIPPPRCGWSEKTLIVRSGEVGEDRPPFEEHYSISEDGQRLIEEVSFQGGRSSGFTLSRVWDRLAQ